MALIVPLTVNAQSFEDKINQGLMLGTVSLSSISLGLTMSCTSSKDCIELNPIMKKFIGDSSIKAVVVKSVVVGSTTYAVWRFTKGKKRTILLGSLFLLNALDAANDIHQMRQIKKRGD